ncbi:uncharacterized protein LOC133397085 [Phycodurus eques]|uniref:uncharacterized protein LOC133397085 n=1 Tax=Phycodurus eques TaxID=693459 RepID=UPI002ACDC272|nr:uncharacterized protein LOC133397085 [Phycodurus eques]
MFVIPVVVVVVVGNIATSVDLSGVNLDCTSDYEKLMSCHFDAPSCTDYNVTMWSLDGYGESYCLPVQCASGKCCCSISMILILDKNHMAFVRRGGEYVESKNISVKHSIKPQTPTIFSVNETNGNFQVIWRTNINKRSIREIISTNLTYRKKGDTKEVTEVVKAPQVETPLCYPCVSTEILGAHLEPSTTYDVTVQSFLPWKSPPSDRSKEYEFSTPASRESLLLTLIISLSLVAITMSSVAYVSYVKCRTKYWDSVSDYQNSKLLDINPSEVEVLKPMPLIISSIDVETLTPDGLKPWSKDSLIDSSTESLLQSSGTSSGPPSLSYACTEAADIIAGVQGALSKALMNIIPVSAPTDHLLKDSNKPTSALFTHPSPCNSEQHSELENTVTYSFIRPSCPVQVKADPLKSHAQPEMPCDCSYQETGGVSTCDKRASACEENMFPTFVSFYTLTATSHQRCSRDSGRFSNGENSDASLSCSNTSLSGDVESRVAAEHEHCQEMFSGACGKGEDATKESEGHICIPASLQGTFPVDVNYQPFQGLRELSDNQFDEQKSDKKAPNKVLENSLEDATKGNNCIPASSNHCFPIDDSYQAFQAFRDLAECQFEGQKSVKKLDLDNVLEISSEDATNGDNYVPANSNRSLLMADSYEVLQGLKELSDEKFGVLNSVKKRDLDNVFEKSLEDFTEGDICIRKSSNYSCLVDDNYESFKGLRELSDCQLEEQKSGKKVSDKVLENTTQGDSCVPASSNYNCLVDNNYKAFQGFRELSDNQFGEQNSGNKEDLKVLENHFEDATKGDNCVRASSDRYLTVADSKEAFQGLRELSDSQFGQQNSGKNEDLEKAFENYFEVACKGYTSIPASSNRSVPVDDNYQAFQGLRKHLYNQVGEPKSGEKENLGKDVENPFDDAPKADNYTCVLVNLLNSLPVDDNDQMFPCL